MVTSMALPGSPLVSSGSITSPSHLLPSGLHSRHIQSGGGLSIAGAYGEYLAAAYPWQWFITMTSRNRVAPEALLKRFRLAVSKLERQLLGRRPRMEDRIVYVVGEERHKSGNPHLHAVMWQRHDLNQLARRNAFRDLLQELSGWSKCEKPHSVAGAVRYCAKYLSKDGELHFSPTFGAHGQIIVV